MRILFITHADLAIHPYGDGSTRYRCFNVAEVAKGYGYSATVMQMEQVQAAELGRYDIISWLRPVASRKFMRLVTRAKQLGIRCVADVDDLIFDPTLSDNSPPVLNGQNTNAYMRKRFASHAKALSCVDAITVSTHALEEHVTRLFPGTPVHTLHNGLSTYWLSWAEQCAPAWPGSKIVAYLPGTRSHDRDFQSISPRYQGGCTRAPKLDWILWENLSSTPALYLHNSGHCARGWIISNSPLLSSTARQHWLRWKTHLLIAQNHTLNS